MVGVFDQEGNDVMEAFLRGGDLSAAVSEAKEEPEADTSMEPFEWAFTEPDAVGELKEAEVAQEWMSPSFRYIYVLCTLLRCSLRLCFPRSECAASRGI